MSTKASSRRGSASSTTSQSVPSPDAAKRIIPSSRISMISRQTSAAMFTGKADPPASPTLSQKADVPASVLSPGTIDRVFPIRSAVSIDPNATPMVRGESGDGSPGMRLSSDAGVAGRREQSRERERGRFSRSSTERYPSPSRSGSQDPLRQSDSQSGPDRGTSDKDGASVIAAVDNNVLSSILSSDTDSVKSQSLGTPSLHSGAASIRDEDGIVTARFKHVVTEGGHAVITGRGGETLQRCEDEPIRIPGAVQSFGLLLCFKEENGKLLVRVVSENSAKIIGYTPAQLFRLNNFLDIFTEEQADNLLDHLDFIRDEGAADVVANGPEVFMISLRPPQHRTRKLWCAMHISDTDRDLVICEFEIEDDQVNPLVPVDDGTPEPPEDTLGSNPTAEELAESTVNISRPLRILRGARKKRGEAAAMEVFNIMSQVQEQMANAPNLQTFLKILIGVVKELSGFHRVMIYQFDSAWNGRVVAELVDPRATKDLYKGEQGSASVRSGPRDCASRLSNDRRLGKTCGYDPCLPQSHVSNSPPVSRQHGSSCIDVDINQCVQRALGLDSLPFVWIERDASPFRSIRMAPIRKMCRLVGDTASQNIERLSYASRLQARKLINTSSSTANPTGYIVASSEDLLKLFDADVGALSIRDETKIMGNAQTHLQEVLAMVEFLRMRNLNVVTTSQDIADDFPDLRYAPGLKHIAGFLYVPFSNGGSDFIVFFRRGVLREVKWAGNPYEKFVKEGTEGYLEPRTSFKMWSETIVGRCRDWTETEVETASVLCLVYGKFIEVWRRKEVALQSSQLTRLLLANSAHEVRTPLNHIINYLEIALEGTLDQETRENLARSHSASKSLVYVINDLLDLTKAEVSRDLVIAEPFDLITMLKEAADPFTGDAKQKGITYTIHIDQDIPQRAVGDQRRVRQVVSNLIANAIQHTNVGSVNVEATNSTDAVSDRLEVEVVVEDTGAGMSQAKVDALFRELEEVSYEPDVPDTTMLAQDPFTDTKDPEQATLGLGLAVVARTIRTMNGQLRLKTEEGKGSRFVIQLGLGIDSPVDKMKRLEGLTTPMSVTPSPVKGSGSGHMPGEVTLVHRNPNSRSGSTTPSIIRKTSADSVHSLKSQKSGKSYTSLHSIASQKSDAKRLIDAIQEPLHLNEDSGGPRPESRSKLSPQHSRGLVSDFVADLSPVNVPQRARSIGSSREMKSALHRVPGEERITDSGMPVEAVKVPEEGTEGETDKLGTGIKVVFDETARFSRSPQRQPDLKYRVLVAEDDPVNSKIMKKRLEKLGHFAYMTINGEECSSVHGEQASSFDVILMDLQMPIVDGYTSTKMIRSFEKTNSGSCLSPSAVHNNRIPIFAVSASLVERERQKYEQCGFDGWILKPVDFKRVDLLLKGIVDEGLRNSCVYEPGKWEQGGWFARRHDQNDMYDVATVPSEKKPTAEAEREAEDGRPSNPSTSEVSITPTQNPAMSRSGTM